MYGLNPDVLVVQEMISASGVSEFHGNVLNAVAPGLFDYVPFHDGPDTDNELFFRTDKLEVLSASYIATELRDIAEYVVRPIHSSEQIRIYSFHLKASSGTANEQERLAEATVLRSYLNNLSGETNFILVGDYNIYKADEPAWQKLIGSETNNNGRSIDPLNLIGTWTSNASLAQYHTQSPRVRSFGGGSTGGMDDRFDIILTSSSLTDNLLVSTYQAYGNDGNHFNDSINRLPNAAVPDSIANALHNASDHLPVTAKFVFQRTALPIQLASLTASLNSTHDSVLVRWTTLTETNNYGFEVHRRAGENDFETVPNSFVPGHGTTLQPQTYLFAEQIPPGPNLQYRLKQIDLNGNVFMTEAVYLENLTDVALSTKPSSFLLSQNYPNPFNPETIVEFSVENTGLTTLDVYNVLGENIATLFDGIALQGQRYKIRFNGTRLASGVYMYRLQSGPSTEIRKMVLMK